MLNRIGAAFGFTVNLISENTNTKVDLIKEQIKKADKKI
jgi:hypothetical protein